MPRRQSPTSPHPAFAFRQHHVLAALGNRDYRRLLGVRLAGQFGDGMFQASLAGTILFNPERQANAADVAAGFAVLLAPYSLAGPFAGVLLDRWSRQRILSVANLVRGAGLLTFATGVALNLGGVGFYVAALVLVSLGRFVLSALSAALPHVVPERELVTANAFATTAGTVTAALGGGAAIGLRGLFGTQDVGYALITALAALPYLLAAVPASCFGRASLGPSIAVRAKRESAREVLRGLAAGVRHLRKRQPVLLGLSAIGVHRLCYGVTTVCTILLYRQYFHADGHFPAGLGGLSQIVAMIAIGGGSAALVTPAAFRRIGPVRWVAGLLAVAAGVQIGLTLAYRLPQMLLAALLLGFVAQAVKITVDTLVQQQIDDSFRGRVFALYDTLFNLTLVVAAVLTATVLPENGHSPASVIAIAGVYAATAIAYVILSSRQGRTSTVV